jgi:hypothetical protein
MAERGTPETNMEVGDMSPTFSVDNSPESLRTRQRIGEIVLLHMKNIGLAMLTTGLTLTAVTPEPLPAQQDSIVAIEAPMRKQASRTHSLLFTALTGAATLAIYGIIKAVPDPSLELPEPKDSIKAKKLPTTPGIES